MSEQTDERVDTTITEWAVRCKTRDGRTYTGSRFTTEREAIASGERLERINGVPWWLVSRHRHVTVETTPWVDTERTTPPRADA